MAFCFRGKKYKLNIKSFILHVVMPLIVIMCVLGFNNTHNTYNKDYVESNTKNHTMIIKHKIISHKSKSGDKDNNKQEDTKKQNNKKTSTQTIVKTKNINKKQSQEMPVVSNSDIKRYEDRAMITDTSSKQYQLCNIYGIAIGNGLVKYDDRYLVAMGQSYGQVGDKFDITLKQSNGEEHTLKVMLGDTKQYCHTVNGEGYYCQDGHVIEGIVDTNNLPVQALNMGDLNYIPEFNGIILKIEKVY